MASNSTPAITGTIDPALEKLLKERGMTNKIDQLKLAESQSHNVLADTATEFGKNIYSMTAAPVVKAVKDLGVATGGAIAAPQINKYQDEQTKAEVDLHNVAMKQIQSPTMGTRQKARALEIIKKTSENPVVQQSEQLISNMPTSKEIVKAGVQLASVALLGFKPGVSQAGLTGEVVAGDAVKNIESIYKVNQAVKAADNARKFGNVLGGAISAAPGFAERSLATGAFMGSLTGEDKTPEQSIKEGIMWGIGGEAFPLVLGTSLKALGFLGKKGILEPAENVAGRVFERMKKYAADVPIEQRLKDAPDVTSRLLSVIEPVKTTGQKIVQKGVDIIEGAKKLPQQLVDRGAPIYNAQEKALQTKGTPLTESEKPYNQFRTRSSAQGLAEEKYSQFQETVVNPYKDIQDEVKARMVGLDALDRSKLASGKIAGGRTQSEIESDLAQHIQIGQDKGIETRIQEAILQNNKFNDQLLSDMRDGGLIDQVTIDRLKEAHPNYIPHQVVLDEADNAINLGGQSVNVGTSPILRAKGSTRAIVDPYETTVEKLPGIYQKIEDNKIGKGLIENQEKYNVFGTDSYALDTAENQTKRAGILTELKQLFIDKRADIRTGQTVAKEIRIADKALTGAENKDFNKAIKDLGTKIDDTDKQMESLMNEAQTMASDMAPKSEINATLEKALTQEKKLYSLNADISKQVEKFNSLNEADIAKKAEVLGDIKLKQKALEVLMADRKETITALRAGLDEAKKISKPLDEQVINFFRDGKKETWVVPEDVAVAVKNLDGETSNAIFKALTAPTKVLKAFATKYSLPFSVQNLARDKQTQAVTAKAFIEDLSKKAGVSPQAINLTDKEILSLYKRSGGFGGSIFDEASNGKELMKKMEDNGFIDTFNNDIRPDQLIAKLNERFESDTRLSTFRQALERGLSPRDAALAAREATVDFAKMGTFMKSLNQIVPFLNARVQGAINTGKAIAMNPEHYARTVMYTSVYPTVALYQQNRQFASYRNIPQQILDNYWVIMTGEADGTDSNGSSIKVPQFIRIKKGEAQQLVSIPVEHYLNKMDGISTRKTSQMLADTIGNFSPVSVGSFSSQNFWLSAISQFGPMANVAVGLGSNVNPGTGQDIVPQSTLTASPYMQYGKTTPENLKELGALFATKDEKGNLIGGISPAKIDFVLNSFGSVPGQIVREANKAEMAIKGETKDKSLTGTWFGENLAQDPMLKSFFGESGEMGSPSMQGKYNQKVSQEEIIANRKLVNKAKAEDIFQTMSKMTTKEAKTTYLDSQFMSPEVKDQLKAVAAKNRTKGVLSASDSTELRANVIYSELTSMKSRGDSKEAQVSYLDGLKKEKILTADVKSELAGMNAYINNVDTLRQMEDPSQRAQYIMDSLKSLKEKGVQKKLLTQYLDRLANEGILNPNMLGLMREIKKNTAK